MNKLKLLDTVAALHPVPLEELTLIDSDYSSFQNLPSGQVATIVEFADLQGCGYAIATLKADELLTLHYKLTIA